MECRNCHKQIADNSTFCPYCGMPTGGVQTGGVPAGDTRQEGMHGIGGYQPVSTPPRRRLPLPALIALGVFGVIVGLFALLLIFSSCSRGSTGGGTVAAPALPTPFEGRVRLRLEGIMGVDFTVLDGESTLSIEGVDGGTMRLTAGLDLVSAESGSGVYRYDLDQLTIDGVSHPVEDIFFPGGVPADADSAIEAYVDALTNAQAQIIIPAGAVDDQAADPALHTGKAHDFANVPAGFRTLRHKSVGPAALHTFCQCNGSNNRYNLYSRFLPHLHIFFRVSGACCNNFHALFHNNFCHVVRIRTHKHNIYSKRLICQFPCLPDLFAYPVRRSACSSNKSKPTGI